MTDPTGPTGPTDPIDPAAPPMTRDDPAYVRWLKVLLVGLGGTVPLEAEEAELTQEEVPLIHYPCASCGATRDVRKLGAPPSASGAGADVYGCPEHASALAAALDDVLPNLEWLLSGRAEARPAE